MPSIKVDIDAPNKPPNFPSADEILQQWRERLRLAEAANPGEHIRGVLLVDGSGAPYAWLKFGPTVTMAEGRTQHFVAQLVNSDAAAPVRVPYVYLTFEFGLRGFIVMEFVDGAAPAYESERDVADAAAAVRYLTGIRAPNSVPGPIGGGLIRHPFFQDRESAVAYPSVDWLQLHVNRASILRLAYGRAGGSVDFSAEVEAHGLRLCPADLNRENFMKDSTGGKIVVLDFGATCFLPVSFFRSAFDISADHFTMLLCSQITEPPESRNSEGVTRASYALVPRGSNWFGLPKELKPLSK
ncbi:hypothetical protein GSI_09765 [Ganoderma sinense ZZ0214-1]|uniref:Aminoglycoside phosphotransferase domain-containing protein n=1 Tax=Ganoderma sinense ZZ0214-1 TaxID=1077348 RepID=A0A2G8S2Z1_9APHY|nr:hypothetical protein GSI_09765 [Ganoderma sinense ZZ0214-1]